MHSNYFNATITFGGNRDYSFFVRVEESQKDSKLTSEDVRPILLRKYGRKISRKVFKLKVEELDEKIYHQKTGVDKVSIFPILTETKKDQQIQNQTGATYKKVASAN